MFCRPSERGNVLEVRDSKDIENTLSQTPETL